ncbi:MAG: DUF1707 domain-containing protein [Actinomycetota bacterium]|nr:DUF1707 domain-containing protein [Actinomycetota bacterium]
MSQADDYQSIPGATAPYADLRVGDAERKAAITALGQQWQAGLLDPAEHERRTTAAFAARTRGDLDALFADLPSDAAVTPRAPGLPSAVAAPATDSPASEGATSWLARNRGAVQMMVPLLAVVFFFLTKQWIFFLLIPIAYILLGTVGGSAQHGDRQRDRRRGRRGGC